MACQNCFNGCAEIISDKCVKYTGVDILPLDIHTGDTLLTVENKITEKILTLMNGTGIIPILDSADICLVVQELLPCCPPFNLNDILTVYVKAICRLDEKNEELKADVRILQIAMEDLNADYDISCLEGVDVTSDTHDIVQAIIDKLCSVEADLQSNYTRTDDLDDFIAAYLAGLPSAGVNSSKMIPFIAYPFFGDVSLFGGTGAGSGVWDRVFLCNGQNGTPDLRGRTLIGATTMGPPPYNSAVDPALVGNPTWVAGGSQGTNSVILNNSQLPAHTHSATSTPSGLMNTQVPFLQQRSGNPPSPPAILTYTTTNDASAIRVLESNTINPLGLIITTTIGNSPGAGGAHPNYQPGTGTNYIMYIPA